MTVWAALILAAQSALICVLLRVAWRDWALVRARDAFVANRDRCRPTFAEVEFYDLAASFGLINELAELARVVGRRRHARGTLTTTVWEDGAYAFAVIYAERER